MAGTRKLSRTTSQRKALLNGLVTSLVLNGKIETTLAKAKEVKPLVDSLIDLAIKEKDNFEVKEKKISRAKLDKNGKKVKVQNRIQTAWRTTCNSLTPFLEKLGSISSDPIFQSSRKSTVNLINVSLEFHKTRNIR